MYVLHAANRHVSHHLTDSSARHDDRMSCRLEKKHTIMRFPTTDRVLRKSRAVDEGYFDS